MGSILSTTEDHAKSDAASEDASSEASCEDDSSEGASSEDASSEDASSGDAAKDDCSKDESSKRSTPKVIRSEDIPRHFKISLSKKSKVIVVIYSHCYIYSPKALSPLLNCKIYDPYPMGDVTTSSTDPLIAEFIPTIANAIFHPDKDHTDTIDDMLRKENKKHQRTQKRLKKKKADSQTIIDAANLAKEKIKFLSFLQEEIGLGLVDVEHSKYPNSIHQFKSDHLFTGILLYVSDDNGEFTDNSPLIINLQTLLEKYTFIDSSGKPYFTLNDYNILLENCIHFIEEVIVRYPRNQYNDMLIVLNSCRSYLPPEKSTSRTFRKVLKKIFGPSFKDIYDLQIESPDACIHDYTGNLFQHHPHFPKDMAAKEKDHTLKLIEILDSM